MSDPYALPRSGDPIPNSATLINALLEGAREDSDSDSVQAGSISFDADFYPYRIIFIQNTTQFQIPSDQPIPIGRPTGDSDFYNGQVVFPIVSYVAGWATFARPLKRLPPGCTGPAVILGWLGPGRRTASYIYGGQVFRRTQPQRAYGGTTFTGIPYLQAARQDFPRPASSPWRDAWYGQQRGISYSGELSARFPKMESLGFRAFPLGEVRLEFRNPVDQHGWWTPSFEFRISRSSLGFLTESAYVYAPASQSVSSEPFSRPFTRSVAPILWQPAVTGFNSAPHAYSGNFSQSPFMPPGGGFNPNGGAPPAEMVHSITCPLNFSTKALWQNRVGESSPIHRSILSGGFVYEPNYVFQADGVPHHEWLPVASAPRQVRSAPGPEVVQIFETDRDDAIRFDSSAITPGVGSGPGGPAPSGSGTVGPELSGPIGLAPAQGMKTQLAEFVQPLSSTVAYGSRLGSGAMTTAAATLSSSGTGAGPI